MGDNQADTKPTIETVLERMADFRKSVESELQQIKIRQDRIESMVLAMRADLAEFIGQFKEHISSHP